VFSDVNDSGLRNPYSGNGSVPYSTINYSDPATGYANKSAVSNNGSVRLNYASENGYIAAWDLRLWGTLESRYLAGGAVWNGRIYLLGAQRGGGGGMPTVESAPILSNGSVGSWRYEPNMTSDREGPGAVVWKGRIYAIEGSTGLGSVESAPILANGSLGAWTSEPRMIAGYRESPLAFAWNDRIYAVSGHSSQTLSESAPILANGSLGSWRAEANVTTARYLAAGAVWNGRAYLLGGYGGSFSVESAPILANGSLGAWRPETSMTTDHKIHGAVAWNGRVYAVGGSGNVSVESAPVLANGSLGAWKIEASLPSYGNDVVAVVWNGNVYAIGGSTARGVMTAPISSNGSLSSWRNETSMIRTRDEFAGGIWNGRIYVVGGDSGSGILDSVESASVLANGSLEAWRYETNLSSTRYGHTVAVWNGRVYAIGGHAYSGYITVESAPVLSNGSLGSWRNETSIYYAQTRLGSTVWNGRMYLVGGYDNGDTPAVESAPILTNGSLGSWAAEPNMSIGRRALAVVAWNGRVYAVGGYNTGGDLTVVESSPILANGSLGVWRNETSMNTGRGWLGAAVWNGRIYAVGSSAYLNSVESAPILANGSTGTWRYEATNMTFARTRPLVFFWNGRMYTIGGVGGSGHLSSVESALVQGLAPAGSYSSKAFDLGSNAALTSLNWTGYKNSGLMQLSYRSASTLEALGSASWSTPVESSDYGGSAALSGSARYFQYQTNVSRGTNDWTPELNDVTLYYANVTYLSGGSLVSQVFDAGANATWNNIAWLQYLPSSATNITLFTRTGASSPPSGAWLPAQGHQSYAPAASGSYGIASANNTRYLQWMALLNTTDSTNTPVLQEVNATYTVP
jgi:hypothetical protein